MNRFAVPLCVGLIVIWSSGCTPSTPKAPPLAKAEGIVLLDGKNMASGEIEFEMTAQPPKMLEIKDGKFSGEVFVGKNTVRIHLYKNDGPPLMTDNEKKPTKQEHVADKYNIKSTLSAEVPAGGVSDLKFDATSK